MLTNEIGYAIETLKQAKESRYTDIGKTFRYIRYAILQLIECGGMARESDAEINRLRAELNAAKRVCHCNDCAWYRWADDGYVCVNHDSDWCADYPPAHCSCEYCESRKDGIDDE